MTRMRSQLARFGQPVFPLGRLCTAWGQSCGPVVDSGGRAARRVGRSVGTPRYDRASPQAVHRRDTVIHKDAAAEFST
jgi:hypothetical protein